MSKKYNIFISHSWSYPEAYDGLIRLLTARSNFDFKDYSVPKDDPIHTAGTDKQLYEAIKRQIQPCHCVLIMSGVYASYSKWIQKEIEIASTEFGKPIIAIDHWGALRASTQVTSVADRCVKWQTESIIAAIHELC
jgi:hypothetical protein